MRVVITILLRCEVYTTFVRRKNTDTTSDGIGTSLAVLAHYRLHAATFGRAWGNSPNADMKSGKSKRAHLWEIFGIISACLFLFFNFSSTRQQVHQFQVTDGIGHVIKLSRNGVRHYSLLKLQNTGPWIHPTDTKLSYDYNKQAVSDIRQRIAFEVRDWGVTNVTTRCKINNTLHDLTDTFRLTGIISSNVSNEKEKFIRSKKWSNHGLF
jgi:hypothetical protein